MKLMLKSLAVVVIVTAGLLLASPLFAQNGNRVRAGQPAAVQAAPCPNAGLNGQCPNADPNGQCPNAGQGNCDGTGQRVRARDGSGMGQGMGRGYCGGRGMGGGQGMGCGMGMGYCGGR